MLRKRDQVLINVNQIFSEGKRLIVWQEERIITFDNLCEELYSGQIHDIACNNDCLLIACDSEGSKILIANNKEIRFNHGVISVLSVVNENELLVITYNDDFTKKYLKLIQVDSGKSIWSAQIGVIDKVLSTKEFIIVSSQDEIKLLRMVDGVVLWKRILSDIDSLKWVSANGFKLVKIVGISEGRMFLDFQAGIVMSFAIYPDEILGLWFKMPDTFKSVGGINANGLLNVASAILDTKHNRLIGIGGTFIWFIDLNTSIIKSQNISDDLLLNGVVSVKKVNKVAHTVSHYFVTGETNYNEDKERRNDAIIAINNETLEIDWCYIFDQEWLATNTPCIGSNDLYQLDADNVLHVFEFIAD